MNSTELILITLFRSMCQEAYNDGLAGDDGHYDAENLLSDAEAEHGAMSPEARAILLKAFDIVNSAFRRGQRDAGLIS